MVLVAMLMTQSSNAAPTFTLTAIPQVENSLATIGVSINANGEVAGYAYSHTMQQQAFVYSNGVSVALPTLGGSRSAALAINDSGQVVGWSETSNPGAHRAFAYSSTSGLSDLGTVGGNQSAALAINSAGQIVGYSTISQLLDNQYRSFVYQSGLMSTVALSTVGVQDSFAYSINSSGQIAGTLYSAEFQYGVAFLHTGANTQVLGTLGGTFSAATVVNLSGLAAGNSATADGATHAFLYDGSLHDLGTISGERNLGFGLGTQAFSGASGMNASGHVVGTYGYSGYQGRGFLYVGGQMFDINDLLDEDFRATWEITDAMGINDAGTIVAYGYRRGDNTGTTLLLSASPTSAVPEAPTIHFFIAALALGFISSQRKSFA